MPEVPQYKIYGNQGAASPVSPLPYCASTTVVGGSSSSSSSTAAIAGAIAGCILALVLAGALGWWCWRRRRRPAAVAEEAAPAQGEAGHCVQWDTRRCWYGAQETRRVIPFPDVDWSHLLVFSESTRGAEKIVQVPF